MSEPVKLSDVLKTVINDCKQNQPENALLWDMVRTLSMLIDQSQTTADMLYELFKQAEQERNESRTAMIENHLRRRVNEGANERQ